MIEEFSSGYYITQMYVQRDRNGPVISKQVYDFINTQIYSDSDDPVTMRLGLDAPRHFGVTGDEEVPRDVLALPPTQFDDDGKQSVFIVKPDYVKIMGEYYG